MVTRRVSVSSAAATRAQRLLQLYLTLADGETITAGELARAAAVTERTVYRDIETLRSAGLPVNGSAGVGYRLEQPYQVAPLLLTRAELRAVIAGAKAVRGGDLGPAAETLLAKAQAVSRRG